MPVESDRQAAYDQLRERFLADPQFRTEFLADPADALGSALGQLTDAERTWVASLGDTSGDDKVKQLKGQVEAW